MNLRRDYLILADSIGALLSAGMLGIVMIKLDHIFSMPVDVLYALAFIALMFAFHSGTCYFMGMGNWNRSLRRIAIANLANCLITMALLFCFRRELTFFDWAYFIAEMCVVIPLAIVECKASRK